MEACGAAGLGQSKSSGISSVICWRVEEFLGDGHGATGLQRGWHVLIRTLKLLPEEMQTPDRGWLAVAAKECSETAVLCVRWDQRAALHVCIFCFSIGEHPGLIWTKPLSSFRDSAPAL